MGRCFNNNIRHVHVFIFGQIRFEKARIVLWIFNKCYGIYFWIRVHHVEARWIVSYKGNVLSVVLRLRFKRPFTSRWNSRWADSSRDMN